MQTQRELELEAYGFGRERAADRIETREGAGHADENPYAQTIYRTFVFPLADAIVAEQEKARGKGRKPAHLRLIGPIQAEASALVAVRAALVHLMGPKGDNARTLFSQVGRAVYHEHLLENFSNLEPKLFHQLANGLARRMSKDERYRLTVYRVEAQKRGLELPEWEGEDIERAGVWMVDHLIALGMLTVQTQSLSKNNRVLVSRMTEETVQRIDQVKHMTVENSPYFLPCVEQPKDWVRYDDGGWHTDEMRRLMPYAVKSSALGRTVLENTDLSASLGCLNALQATPWRINAAILAVLRQMGGKFDLGEVLAQGEDPRPEKPAWLTERMDVEEMDADQLRDFKRWKRETAKWYSKTKDRVVKWGRYRNAMDVASKFEHYSRIYFVYFCDFRDRKYALTTGVSPQGSDLQKALLEFAEGAPLDTKDAQDWFCITGANRFGYDKEDLPARVAWVREHHAEILLCAADPSVHQWWISADKPLQFLAWCFEYSNWQTFGGDFLTRLSVGMDGSCNGLQNFSAMLRDEVGGRATNLVRMPKPQDIYGRVAEVTTQLLLSVPPDETGFRDRWLAHGMNRKITKRSVMTLPYGSTRYSCADFIAQDYLSEGLVPEFDEMEHLKAAQYLSKHVWKAIADVVVKAREAMDWLQQSATEIIASGENRIMWITPTGFPVVQAYWEEQVKQINSKLAGRTRLLVRSETSKADKRRHRNGISPNFVHSLDAAHLTRVTLACKAAGIDNLHMVHDDFGCPANRAADMYRIIREEFVKMYESNHPLVQFQARYPQATGPIPAQGNLDLREVLDSPFFFS